MILRMRAHFMLWEQFIGPSLKAMRTLLIRPIQGYGITASLSYSDTWVRKPDCLHLPYRLQHCLCHVYILFSKLSLVCILFLWAIWLLVGEGGSALCTAGSLAASLASTQQMPVAPIPIYSCDNEKFLQTYPLRSKSCPSLRSTGIQLLQLS